MKKKRETVTADEREDRKMLRAWQRAQDVQDVQDGYAKLLPLVIAIIRGDEAALAEERRIAAEDPESYARLKTMLLGHRYGKMAER